MISKIINQIKDENGNVTKTTYEDENGNIQWSECIYNENGQQLSYENSEGYWSKNTYDENGNKLTCKDSDGAWWEEGWGWFIV